MKKSAMLLFLLPTNSLFSDVYTCKEHKNILTLKKVGYEHINHLVYINGSLVKELEENMWFVKEVKCTKHGFKVIANHAQYGNFTEKVFLITSPNKVMK